MFCISSILLFIIAGAIEFDSASSCQWLIAFFCVSVTLICLGIAIHLYKKIMDYLQEPAKENLSNIRWFIIIIVLTIIELFGFAYSVINSLLIDSFQGVSNTKFGIKYLEFQYFSVMTFSTVGYGDIAPNCLIAKIATMIEALVVLMIISLGSIMFFTVKKREA